MADDEKIVKVMMVNPPATRLEKWIGIASFVATVLYVWLGFRSPRRKRG